MIRFLVMLVLLATPALADSLVATRVIRAQTLLAPADMTLVAAEIPGALGLIEEAIGQEARVTLYPGRAIRAADIGPPALVDRNQVILLVYNAGGLGITAEGRAMERGGEGDVIKVMNLASRQMIVGRVAKDGAIHVGQIH
jgi:flagella basal body P-ring formation protein FlgA